MEEISIKDLVPLIEEVIESGTDFQLFPKGTSMNPHIIEGEDSVILTKPVDLKIYDAVLYKRDNDQYVLHRIVAEHGDYFDMCGDNQFYYEKNIKKSSVIAKVTGIYKKNELIDVSSVAYRNKIEIFYHKKYFKIFLYKIKRLIYPIYKAIFK